MRIILLALGALIALGGGAAGAYFYFMKPAEASAVEKFDEHAKADDNGSGLLGHFEYLELDPLILPIVDSKGVSQTVSLVIAIEVPSSSAKIKAQNKAPKLKDAFIQDMYGVLNKHAALKGGVLQVDVLKKRLNHVSERVLGEENVNDVLLQVVQQRPI